MGVATVKAHISSILSKLGFDNRTQLALLAHDAGLEK
jgi:DNA-binding NarL/FixJ family response regulator